MSHSVHLDVVGLGQPVRHTGSVSNVVQQRAIDFEGAHNFRDVGGYASRFGGRVRWGMVYRAGRLDQLTASDLERFEALGIRTVFDLRNDDERARLPDPMTSIHVSLVSGMMRDQPPTDFASVIDYDDGIEFMRQLYSLLLAHAAHEMGLVLAGLAAPDQLPALMHCTAGKDRTGVLAALLLELLGVDRETVLDDFELTAELHNPEHTIEAIGHMTARGISPEAAAGAMTSSRSSMAAALVELDQVYGGAERYILDQAGLSAPQVAQLRCNLITP